MPVSNGLSATGLEPRTKGLNRLIRWSDNYGGWHDETIFAGEIRVRAILKLP